MRELRVICRGQSGRNYKRVVVLLVFHIGGVHRMPGASGGPSVLGGPLVDGCVTGLGYAVGGRRSTLSKKVKRIVIGLETGT